MRGHVHRLAALLILAALVLSLSACNEATVAPESPSPSFQVSAALEPETAKFTLGCAAASPLHPLKTTDQSNLNAGALVYEGLYELDDRFEPQPVLATSALVSEDGLTWTVTLRTDAAFSDGTPLTAAQAVSSLRTAMSSGVYAARLSGISALAEQDGAVVISLNSPNGALPALLNVPIVLENGTDTPLGTGPYVYDTDGENLWLAANPNWWQGRRPLYDVIPIHLTQSLEEQVSAFDSGLVTAVTTDFNAAGTLGYSGTYETHDFYTTNMLFVGFNTAEGACSNALLRAALSRAFDRNSIVVSFLSGHGDAAALPISPWSKQYSQAAASRLDYDLEAAASLLEQAGYTYNDEGLLVRGRTALSLTLAVNQDSLVKLSTADYIAQNLQSLGMDVTVQKLTWDDYTAALAAGQFDLYVGEVKLMGDFDFTSLVSGRLNYGGYQNETVSGLLLAWKAASGADRTTAAEALFAALADDLPFAPLCFKRESLLVRWGMVGTLSPTPGNPFAGIEDWQIQK